MMPEADSERSRAETLMPKTLVIVESPAKAKTISRFLGGDYSVQASYGHIRDLPEGSDQIPAQYKKEKWARLGVNIAEGYKPLYVVSPDKKRRVDDLKKAAKECDRILLATDEDREGESISWHVLEVLKPKKSVEVKRIVFHEITPEAIEASLQQPRDVDENLVRAQETRRILDRLYGYTLSPLLWRKVAPRLSAGRVQSVAVRLIVQRERERRDFVTAAYSSIQAQLGTGEGSLDTKLIRIDGKDLANGQSFDESGKVNPKVYWLQEAEAEDLASRLLKAEPWKVTVVSAKPGRENPPEPFMTSSLQQDANRKFGFPARRTMQIAQELYEGIDLGGSDRVGLITYMRTDSLTLADRALTEARQVISGMYGSEYLPASPVRYKSKAKGAQEAHEAIRPTDLGRTPDSIKNHLSAEQFKLYELIWKRTLACQMKPAEVERTRVEVEVSLESRDMAFSASGKRIVFPGFLRVYVEGVDDPDAELEEKEKILPKVTQGQVLNAEGVDARQHETKPPARYTEATLVRTLEANGVGRPSTYASIIGTIQDRGYVFKKNRELVPTFTAFAVTDLLENHFAEYVDTGFTARMEQELDDIAEGELDALHHLKRFYEGEEGQPGLDEIVTSRTQEIPFPLIELGEELVVRIGRNGPFIQRGEGGTGNTASLPDDLPPADLTAEMALKLLEERQKGPEAIGTDPASGRSVFLKKGRFGAYLELESEEGEETPRRVTLPPGAEPGSLTDEDLGGLFSFPKELGKDPESGEPVVLAIGRYGAYLTAGDKRANVGEWREALNLTLDKAMEAIAKGGTGRSSKPQEIKKLGAAPDVEGEIRVMSGRYGPYVTNGTTNATLPKGSDPEAVTLEAAAEMIKAKATAGPSKRKRFTRKKRS